MGVLPGFPVHAQVALLMRHREDCASTVCFLKMGTLGGKEAVTELPQLREAALEAQDDMNHASRGAAFNFPLLFFSLSSFPFQHEAVPAGSKNTQRHLTCTRGQL